MRSYGSDLDTGPLLRASSSASLYPGLPISALAGFFFNWTHFWRDIFPIVPPPNSTLHRHASTLQFNSIQFKFN
jgi:hypothetical protein